MRNIFNQGGSKMTEKELDRLKKGQELIRDIRTIERDLSVFKEKRVYISLGMYGTGHDRYSVFI